MPVRNARLVRDFVPALAAQSGNHLLFDVAPLRTELLADKLVEEAQELAQAESEGEVVLRLAAIWELATTIALMHDLVPEDLDEIIERIQAQKGGFQRGYVVKES